MEKRKLKCIVVENPYDLMEDAVVRHLFAKVIQLKISGYSSIHGYGVMPVDASDYIANHIMVCEESESGWELVCAYRSVPLERCMTFGLEFPPLTLAKKGGSASLQREVQAMIDSSLAAGRPLSYDSSWTVEPKLRGERKLNRMLMEMVAAFSVLYHRDYNLPDWITAGILRLETHAFFLRMGMVPFENDPVFKFHAVFDEESMMVKWKESSAWAQRMAQRYGDFWAQRKTYRADRIVRGGASEI